MLREQFGDLRHWDEQSPASFDEKSESVALIELRCVVVLGVDHKGVGRDVVPQHAAKGIEEHELAVPLLPMASTNRQPSHQRCGHDRIAWQPLRQRLGEFGKSDAGRRKRVIADRNAVAVADQYEARGDPPPYVLPRLLSQIPVQRLDATSEALSIMLVRQRLDTQSWRSGGHSGAGQLEVSLCGRLEPSVWLPRMEKRLREGPAIGGAQPDRVRFLNDADGRVMHTGDHEIRQRAPLQLGGALEQRLLVAGDPRLQPLISRLGRGFLGHVAYTLSCTWNVGKMYG